MREKLVIKRLFDKFSEQVTAGGEDMINAPVVSAVQDLLKERGVEERAGERLADFVARGLGISDAEAEAFLQRVHDGATVEQAQAEAGIRVEEKEQSMLVDIARVIGTALGRVAG